MNVDYALLTDLYQITMAQGYWDAEKAGEEACFTMYFQEINVSVAAPIRL